MAKEPAKKGKRQVKDPETFRQRAQKATEASEKPKKTTRLKSGGAKAVGPIRSTTRKITGAKALKPLHKPARIVGKILVPAYFRSSWAELKQVNWPNWQKSRRLTTAVFIFAIIFGIVIASVDWVLGKIFKQLILS